MSKIIYMERTLAMIAQQDQKEFERLIKAGKVCQTESGIRYLLIEE